MEGDGSSSGTSSQELAARLAHFAAGCLGAATPARAGSRLGLMGSASQEEFGQVLHHMETLARQRAAKLAGLSASATPMASSGSTPCCSSAFQRALSEACGEPTLNIAGIFLRLPRDESGRADLLRVFQMEAEARKLPAPESAATATDASLSHSTKAAVPADYVEQASDLPAFSKAEWETAECAFLQVADEANWAADTAAVNLLRSAMAHGEKVEVTAPLLSSLAQRCACRRPALSKTALRALTELAGQCQGVPASASSPWLVDAEAVLGGCLAAIRVTKVAARLAETALAAISRCLAANSSPSAAAKALAACASHEVSSRVPQPLVVAAALRALTPLLPGLAVSQAPAMTGSAEAVEAVSVVSKLCQDVLACRKLAPSFAEARSVSRTLKELEDKGAAKNKDNKTEPLQEDTTSDKAVQ
eukprot:TRINITY_DN29344_c0_g1_i1.p1 TRINITY_DN29344_c0_g1~~TRINITY_DN29344_c0_g1_i1.p1  ORF type:complete len:443 (-),score=91.76 TRINITY_DN29344_c0_g1_i1:16-1275(-)